MQGVGFGPSVESPGRQLPEIRMKCSKHAPKILHCGDMLQQSKSESQAVPSVCVASALHVRPSLVLKLQWLAATVSLLQCYMDTPNHADTRTPSWQKGDGQSPTSAFVLPEPRNHSNTQYTWVTIFLKRGAPTPSPCNPHPYLLSMLCRMFTMRGDQNSVKG